MNKALYDLFMQKSANNNERYEQSLAEVIQSIALLRLSRTNFFERSAFYGGTALRILYGLDRFSEDLDFSLLEPDPDFKLMEYYHAIAVELKGFGLNAEIYEKQKSVQTSTESAFIKTDTIIAIAAITGKPESSFGIPQGTTKVKFEIDINPPSGAKTEMKYCEEPIPFSLRCYDLPSLFAGKMHALLARSWKNRVKGRDWYDYTFYITKKVPVALHHLEARLRQTGHYSETKPLSKEVFIEMVKARIMSIDFENAKKDVERFIQRPQDLDVWSKDFFMYLTSKIEIQ